MYSFRIKRYKRTSGIVLCSDHCRASQMALMVKKLPAKAGDVKDVGSVPGLERFPGEGHDNPL